MSKYGFVGDNGKIYLTRCPECERENYVHAVASGHCCWCGYKGEMEDVE